MATYVLIPGFWLGGWAWKQVTRELRAIGHQVYPMTLTGLGERVHLAHPSVDLDTHIQDILNLLAYEDLQDVILVGHSGGNMSTTGVANRVPERIAQVVYLDTAPLPSGLAQVDFHAPELRQAQQQLVEAQGDGWRLAMPSWEALDNGPMLEGLTSELRAFIRSHATDQPFRTATQPLHFDNPQWTKMPKTAIWCTAHSSEVRDLAASGLPIFSELGRGDWQFFDLPTGHWPMFSRPHDLAMLLAQIGDQSAVEG